MYLKVKTDEIPKGRLVKGPYKAICRACRDCAIYFSITVPTSISSRMSFQGFVAVGHLRLYPLFLCLMLQASPGHVTNTMAASLKCILAAKS